MCLNVWPTIRVTSNLYPRGAIISTQCERRTNKKDPYGPTGPCKNRHLIQRRVSFQKSREVFNVIILLDHPVTHILRVLIVQLFQSKENLLFSFLFLWKSHNPNFSGWNFFARKFFQFQMANFEGFGEDSPSQSRRPGLENMSERVQLISYSIYDELEVFVDSFGRDAGHGFIATIVYRL